MYVWGPGVLASVVMVTVEIRLDPGDRSIDGLLRDTASPSAVGVENAVALTTPVSPRLVTVTVNVVEPPAVKLAGEGDPATRVKSPVIVTVKLLLCDTVPLVPTMFTA